MPFFESAHLALAESLHVGLPQPVFFSKLPNGSHIASRFGSPSRLLLAPDVGISERANGLGREVYIAVLPMNAAPALAHLRPRESLWLHAYQGGNGRNGNLETARLARPDNELVTFDRSRRDQFLFRVALAGQDHALHDFRGARDIRLSAEQSRPVHQSLQCISTGPSRRFGFDEHHGDIAVGVDDPAHEIRQLPSLATIVQVRERRDKEPLERRPCGGLRHEPNCTRGIEDTLELDITAQPTTRFLPARLAR